MDPTPDYDASDELECSPTGRRGPCAGHTRRRRIHRSDGDKDRPVMSDRKRWAPAAETFSHVPCR